MICRASHQSWIISVIFALALGVRLMYWVNTPPTVRGHDMAAHFEYVTDVAQNWTRPDRNAGWESYQAPLYYYIAASIVSLERHFGIAQVGVALMSLQGLSLVLSMLTAIAALLCFKECARIFNLEGVQGTRVVALALALYVFWPTVIIDSVRIGNDSLLELLAVISLFFILRWHSLRTQHSLLAASVTVAIAIVTKASAVLLLPVLGLAAGLEWSTQLNRRTLYRHLLWLAPVFVIAGLITFGSAVRERVSGVNTSLLVQQNADSTLSKSNLAVGTRPRNYLLFNPKQFIVSPFTDPWHDENGRQIFWYYFWKTSLFGESSPFGRFRTQCGRILSGLLLLLLILACSSTLYGNLKQRMPMASIVAFAVVWIGGTLAFSILHPFSVSRDFRYAAPALVSICWLVSLSVPHFASRRWPRIAACAGVFMLLFTSVSIAFVLRLPPSD